MLLRSDPDEEEVLFVPPKKNRIEGSVALLVGGLLIALVFIGLISGMGRIERVSNDIATATKNEAPAPVLPDIGDRPASTKK